jgi:hypothetical protein
MATFTRALDPLRRGRTALADGFAVRLAAAKPIRELTGRERYSPFDKFLADQDGAPPNGSTLRAP